MALLTVQNVKIAGVSAAVPKEIEKVGMLECFAQGEAEKVMALTGIKERRIAPQWMTCSVIVLLLLKNL